MLLRIYSTQKSLRNIFKDKINSYKINKYEILSLISTNCGNNNNETTHENFTEFVMLSTISSVKNGNYNKYVVAHLLVTRFNSVTLVKSSVLCKHHYVYKEMENRIVQVIYILN